MVLVTEVPGAMVKAGPKSCFQLPRCLHSTVGASTQSVWGRRHLGDSSSASACGVNTGLLQSINRSCWLSNSL